MKRINILWSTLLIVFVGAIIAIAAPAWDKDDHRWDGTHYYYNTYPLVFEGATENDYQTTLVITDPTADRTFTFPDSSGTYITSSLGTNGIDIVNSVWGGTNQFIFEGATADAHETILTPVDATADRTVSLQNKSGTVALVEATLVEVVTATNVITAAECGTTYYLNSTTEFASTLPAVSTVAAGCEFKFVVLLAPAAASYTVLSGNTLENVITGGIVERETDTNDDGPYQADGDTITIADGVAVAGDYFELLSDGSKYYLHGQANADGGIVPSQAD